jgi:hypothetical protein
MSLRDRGQLRAFHEVSGDRRTWVEASSLKDLFPSARENAQPKTDERADAPSGGPPEQSAEWYYMDHHGRQQGPVSGQDMVSLRESGSVTESTMVWKQGLAEWVPVLDTDLRKPNTPGDFCWTGAKRLRWQRVRLGITLVLVGTFVLSAAEALWTLGTVVAIFAWGVSLPMLIMGIVMGIVAFLPGKIVEVIGYGFCIPGPRKFGARGLAITLLVLGICGIFLLPCALLSMGLLFPLIALQGGATTIVFLFLMRALALVLENDRLSRRAVYLLIVYGAAVFLSFVVGLLVLATPAGFAVARMQDVQDAFKTVTALVVAICIFAILALAAFMLFTISYIISLFQLRAAISNHLSPGEEEY